ncbi:hypothetical protein TCAL_14219 [Tigriopus californicus]|uniref:Essential MCU regulator, mitochondrial n=1 Tax=Tigriopus californicus TaxID=6832 RepID=A0A553NVJ0_TIGCA|nr:hypothetical protein TCAL_14219 [Tigriopus californicus]
MALLCSSAVLFRDLMSYLIWGCLLCAHWDQSLALQLPRGYPDQTFGKDHANLWNRVHLEEDPNHGNDDIRFESLKLSEVAESGTDPRYDSVPGLIETSDQYQYEALPEFNPDYIDAEIWAVEEDLDPNQESFHMPHENDLVDQDGQEVDSFINEYFKYLNHDDTPTSHVTEPPRKIRFKPTLKAPLPTEAVLQEVAPLSERVSDYQPDDLPIDRLPGNPLRLKHRRKHHQRKGNGRLRKPSRRRNGGFSTSNEPQPLTEGVANFLQTILPAFVTLGSILGFGLGAMTFDDRPENAINFNPRFQVSGTNISIDYF